MLRIYLVLIYIEVVCNNLSLICFSIGFCLEKFEGFS